jgi:hypothetical protein
MTFCSAIFKSLLVVDNSALPATESESSWTLWDRNPRATSNFRAYQCVAGSSLSTGSLIAAQYQARIFFSVFIFLPLSVTFFGAVSATVAVVRPVNVPYVVVVYRRTTVTERHRSPAVLRRALRSDTALPAIVVRESTTADTAVLEFESVCGTCLLGSVLGDFAGDGLLLRYG